MLCLQLCLILQSRFNMKLPIISLLLVAACSAECDLETRDCGSALGMEDGTIPNSDITASSQAGNCNHAPRLGRLNQMGKPGWAGAWCSRYNDFEQWLQVDFTDAVRITAVATQGRQDHNHWVRSYTLGYSQDGGYFEPYTRNGQEQVFGANNDRHRIVRHALDPPIMARYVRIYPKSWYGHICMRAEFFGCRTGFVKPPKPVCEKALGMQSGLISDAMIKSSSDHSGACRSANGRLYFRPMSGRVGSWCSRRNDMNQYLQVDFKKWTKVTRVAIQGRYDHNQWVKKYSIEYSYDCVFFKTYKINGNTAIFQGNTERHRPVSSSLEPPVVARCIRIRPQGWNSHISMRSEFYGCHSGFDLPDIGCARSMGVEDRSKMSDSSITASSQWDTNHGPSRARLNLKVQRSPWKSGAWSARYNDKGQWLQFDLGKITKITRIATQGRDDANQWVTSYSLSYSYFGSIFHSYQNGKVFQGNKDRNTIMPHILGPAIIARYLRFHPQSWLGHISMRAELYGCHSGFTLPPIPKCSEALGMQNGRIKDAQISGTDLNTQHRAQNARLHFHAGGGRTGSWSARRNDDTQYLQVSFNKPVSVTKVGTQGRQEADQWVTRYTLSFSQEGLFWEHYKVNGRTKVFSGSSDRYTVVINEVKPAIIAKYIRIHPQTWHRHISMRFELYGCRAGFKPPSLPPCREELGMKSRVIADNKITASSEYNHQLLAKFARLHNKAGRGVYGSWCSRQIDLHQWMQVDFGKATKVTAIATQGRPEANQWVKKYSLQYSQDGLVFTDYDNGKDFQGNVDRHSISAHLLNRPIIARYVRFKIKSWQSRPCMRFEVYGCRRGFVAPPTPSCTGPLGMEDYAIANQHIKASSEWHPSHGAHNARLNFKKSGSRTGGWSARHNNDKQWIQVDMERIFEFTRVAIQGRQDYRQWVKSFTFSYSLDQSHWTTYKENGKDKVFSGNWDQNTIVYHALNPPVMARYARINVKSWYGHISMRCEFYGCEGKVPLIQQPAVSVGIQKLNGKTNIFAKCQFSTRPNKFVKVDSAVYEVDWVVDDKVVRTETLSGVRKFALLEGNTHGFKAGSTISCKVRGKFNLPGGEISHWSAKVESSDFFAGLVVNPTNIVVSENQASERVAVTSTVPVCCGSVEECGLTVEINQVDDVITNKCDLQFQNSKLTQDFQVKALKDFLDDGNRQVQLTFQKLVAHGSACSFWNGYQPKPVKVITIDEGHEYCLSNGDPHYTSFDGRRFNILKYPGDYRMVTSKARNFEVHCRTWKCWKTTCNCAVAVRENNDVITVDMCNGRWGHTTPKVIQKSSEPLGDRVKVRKITAGRSTTYKLFFRSGAEVEAKVYNWGLNVKITVPSDDRENTEGVCGNNNGNQNDDFNGAKPMTYKIPLGQSLFDKLPPKVSPEKPFACTCKKASWGGSYLTCDVMRRGVNINEGKPADILPPNGGRRGKSAVSYKFNPGTVDFKPVQWPTPSGITEQKAREVCMNSIEKSPAGKACHKLIGKGQDQLVADCVLDIAVSDTLSIKDSALEAMLEECRDGILRKPKGRKRSLEDNILGLICPDSCSGHGACRNAKCECEKGYGAADCSIELSKPPVLDGLLSHCDTHERDCSIVDVVGNGFLDSEKLTCHITMHKHSKGKWIPDGHKVSKGKVESFREVDCNVPVAFTANRKFSGPVKLDIAISNDGKGKSNNESFIIFDSDCFIVTERGLISQKDNICVINGACYTEGEVNPTNERHACLPSKSAQSWSTSPVQADEPEEDDTEA